jgi:hypothetical protein
MGIEHKRRSTPKAATATPTGSVTLCDADQKMVKGLIGGEGVVGAMKILMVSRTTVLAAAAGCGVRRASAEMISRRLREGAAGVG